jgi:hypothetical protein
MMGIETRETETFESSHYEKSVANGQTEVGDPSLVTQHS